MLWRGDFPCEFVVIWDNPPDTSFAQMILYRYHEWVLLSSIEGEDMFDDELASSNELVDNREGLLVKEGKVVLGGY